MTIARLALFLPTRSTGRPRVYRQPTQADSLCRSLIEAMGEGEEVVDLGGRKVPIRQYASWFNFKGGDQQKTVGNLSGLISFFLSLESAAAVRHKADGKDKKEC